MNDAPHPALLPAGLYDLLPPDAEIEAEVTGRLMGVLAAHGYERVKPPLVEFEESLLSGPGTAMTSDTFRTMDPISHRMIGVRADMTPQIARIAATRLAHRARPLRLSYAGQVLRVKGSEMRPERQVGQAGAELIGAEGPAADVEAIAVAGEALATVGVPHLSVDITLPTLVPAIAEAYRITGERAAALRAALDHKDAAAVAGLAGSGAIANSLRALGGGRTASRLCACVGGSRVCHAGGIAVGARAGARPACSREPAQTRHAASTGGAGSRSNLAPRHSRTHS